MSKKVFDFKSTKDIKVPKTLVDQVIGQEHAVEVFKKAAKQRRHVFLIGEPGTGKSMLGFALAEMLPKENLVDIIAFPNPNDSNKPLIRTVKPGKGREIVANASVEASSSYKNQTVLLIVLAVISSILPYYFWKTGAFSDVIYAASLITGMIFIIGVILMLNLGKRMMPKGTVPKIIVDNFNKKQAPFYDATGARAGALLGDVLHDPFQSGGLGTPPHERVVAGMIHKANMGVLFIDEIALLPVQTQQELLTAIQEKKFPITGQSERSAGAMVVTEQVPCNFILIAAGNLETLKNLHPALRSRIKGYGYEVYMNESMKDTEENQKKIATFIAQEVNKDGKIPHFNVEGVKEMLNEARLMANRKNHLTLRLRELGGLVRASGDLALEQGATFVSAKHVRDAKKIARTLEKQIADRFISRKKEYDIIVVSGKKVGRVNGLAVIGAGGSLSGIILPIEAEVTAQGKEKQIVATGKLGEIAKEAITNVSAIIKKYFAENTLKLHKDIFVQFLQTYEGVEGDSASIAVATAVVSALKEIPVRQEVAMTGSLSVRGEVLPVGGVSAKVDAAINAGIKKVVVPKSNMEDIVLGDDKLKKIKIIPVKNIVEVLSETLDWNGNTELLTRIKKEFKKANS